METSYVIGVVGVEESEIGRSVESHCLQRESSSWDGNTCSEMSSLSVQCEIGHFRCGLLEKATRMSSDQCRGSKPCCNRNETSLKQDDVGMLFPCMSV